MPTTDPISVALLAYGMSGRVFHGPLLTAHPGFALRKVWQRSKNDAQRHYPEVQIERELEAILQDPDIELVVVNTPEFTHAEFAKRALEAGKHVVVEKAFTVTSAEAEELIHLARTKDLVLSVFHNRRWDSDFLTVQSVFNQGLLGRLVEFVSRYDRYRPEIRTGSWEEEDQPGTGILYNLGSHLIDQALTLFAMPKKVWADLQIQRSGGQVPDHFQLVMWYPSLKATLRAGYLVKEPQPRYTLLGEKGSFVKYGLDPQEDALNHGILPGSEDWGVESEAIWGTLNTALGKLSVRGIVESLPGNYLRYYDQVYGAIRDNSHDFVDAEQGRDVIRVIEAAYQSAATGEVVEL